MVSYVRRLSFSSFLFLLLCFSYFILFSWKFIFISFQDLFFEPLFFIISDFPFPHFFFFFLISHSLFSTPNNFGGGIDYPQIGIMLAHFFFLSLCTSVWVSRFSSLGRQRIADWRRCTSQYQPNEKLGSGDQREVEPSSAGFFIITVSGISSS